ncbi:hypothetical protein MGSAQ_001313, partial [marine sediment metagenome]
DENFEAVLFDPLSELFIYLIDHDS